MVSLRLATAVLSRFACNFTHSRLMQQKWIQSTFNLLHHKCFWLIKRHNVRKHSSKHCLGLIHPNCQLCAFLWRQSALDVITEFYSPFLFTHALQLFPRSSTRHALQLPLWSTAGGTECVSHQSAPVPDPLPPTSAANSVEWHQVSAQHFQASHDVKAISKRLKYV